MATLPMTLSKLFCFETKVFALIYSKDVKTVKSSDFSPFPSNLLNFLGENLPIYISAKIEIGLCPNPIELAKL